MSSVQYSALTRLLSHNNRVHDLEETLRQMNAPLIQVAATDEGLYEEGILSPIADLQEDIDREVRASLVTCWLGIPAPTDDWDEV